MKIEDQICSLSQAKRLKGLGVKQDALFYHTIGVPQIPIAMQIINMTEQYAAFTVAELGVMLPDGKDLKGSNNIAQFNTFRHIRDNKWSCFADYASPRISTEYGDVYESWKNVVGNTESKARAAMLIYLLENNLIAVDEINARI